jgi:hypothetical protein
MFLVSCSVLASSDTSESAAIINQEPVRIGYPLENRRPSRLSDLIKGTFPAVRAVSFMGCLKGKARSKNNRVPVADAGVRAGNG